MSRERLLLAGDVSTGKTRALFDIAVQVLEVGRKVFYYSFDDGHHRFLPRVEKYIENGQFILLSSIDWPEIRRTYKEHKLIWEKGDWVMVDRVDLLWDELQVYYKADALKIPRDDLVDYFVTTRIEHLQDDVKKNEVSLNEFTDMDWDLIKSSYRSLVWDVNGGRDASQLQLNTAMTTWALPGVQARTTVVGGQKVETASSLNDPRKLRILGVTLQGEKHTAGYFETILLLKTLPRGYVVSTYKDRERAVLNEVLVDNLADVYQLGTNVRFT